jgi:hypothetical protein
MKVGGAIERFVDAVRKVPGLELVDAEELDGDELDKSPVVYLLFPDVRALKELASLWERWRKGQVLDRGFAPWKEVFALLRDLRPWGPQDRLSARDRMAIEQKIAESPADHLVRLELELVFRPKSDASDAKASIKTLVQNAEGRVLDEARLDAIAYEALLVELPLRSVKEILDHEHVRDTLAWADAIMHIRPQAEVDVVPPEPEVEQGPPHEPPEPGPEPILALLDGVPVAKHPRLARHLIVEDLFDLESRVPVSQRKHGTAMASLIVWGDLNRTESTLPRKIVHIPVLGPNDRAPDDQLFVDLFYRAIKHVVSSTELKDILIFNISLGNVNDVYQGLLSPWARLVDTLAYEHGLLFVISAGNHCKKLPLLNCANSQDVESKPPPEKCKLVLRSIDCRKAERRLLSPAESINGLTVGAANVSAGSPMHGAGGYSFDPYPGCKMANPSSALGPGFANAVKPDVLLPGGREELRYRKSNPVLEVAPTPASRFTGLKVAAPEAAMPGQDLGYAVGTSAAAALASRTAHRIHNVLEEAYGHGFVELPKRQRAMLLKAFLVHAASWPPSGARLIRETTGPTGNSQHVRRKDNIRRYLGYGLVDTERAIRCATDRATFWAVGDIAREQAVPVSVPVPALIGGKAQTHEVRATLAWLAPAKPGTLRYRGARLKLREPEGLRTLGVKSERSQPDQNQAARGTVIHRRWSGHDAATVTPGDWLVFVIQRDPDPLDIESGSVPFALVVTIEMPSVQGIYEEVRARLGLAVQVRA